MSTEQNDSKTYIEAVGRRKTAIARVRLYEAGKTTYIINDNRDLPTYFPHETHQLMAKDAFVKSKVGAKFKVSAHISGGGIASQAKALRHAISRALLLHDSTLRKELKSKGFLKRDPRAKERRKFGLKKARKAPQWSKR